MLASRLPEIESILTTYQVGAFIDNHEPQHIASTIEGFLTSSHYNIYKNNTKKAALENNWTTEKKVLEELIIQIK